jgi:hypothetical protein
MREFGSFGRRFGHRTAMPTRSGSFDRLSKEECLNRVIPLGERHLRRTIADFVVHYQRELNHQGIGNELIQPLRALNGQGPVRRHQRIGGMLNYYHRAA